MKQISLTDGRVALVDDDEFHRLSAFKWLAQKSTPEGNWYAKRLEKDANGRIANIYMHRDILGALPGEEVDHKDRNGLNNTKENLRLCNRSQNNANIAQRRRPASGFIGVYYDPERLRPWIARCWSDGRSTYLGRFSTPEAAALVRDKFVRAHWGEFAVLNFPELAA